MLLAGFRFVFADVVRMRRGLETMHLAVSDWNCIARPFFDGNLDCVVMRILHET